MRIALVSLLAFAAALSCSDQKEYLFNGEDLNNWSVFVEDPAINPAEFFYVNDGMIETVGVPNGYLRTKKEKMGQIRNLSVNSV